MAEEQNEEGYAIGIDLGTTYSCAAVWFQDSRGLHTFRNKQGSNITPSLVAFNDHEKLIGEAAGMQIMSNPTNTVFDVKRLIGKRYSDPDVQTAIKFWPFKIIDVDDKPMIVVSYKGEEKHITPEEISSMILTYMRRIAESFLQSPVKNAVVTVPAHFNDSQRKATKYAGALADLNIMRIINEPTAAAIAYRFGKGHFNEGYKLVGEQIVFVFDLGGGTLDVSLLSITDDFCTVLASCGADYLGGEDFNNRMLDHFIKEFKTKNDVDISGNPKAIRRLRFQCEKAKKLLSFSRSATIELDNLSGTIDFASSITRAEFEELNIDLFTKCMKFVDLCVNHVKMDKSKIDEVVLVGGSSRISKVQQLLQDYFNRKDLFMNLNPEEDVARGAAVKAYLLSNGNSFVRNFVISDVTPLSLGIMIKGGIMSVLIPRNTTIPTMAEQSFSTRDDSDPGIEISIYEGERIKASDNNFLGSLMLSDIPCVLKGHPFTVYFEIDENGILQVSAMDKVFGVKNKIVIAYGKEKLSSGDISMMIEEAKAHEAEDKRYMNKKKAMNALQHYILKVRNVIDEIDINLKNHPENRMEIDSAIMKAKHLVDFDVFADFLDGVETTYL